MNSYCPVLFCETRFDVKIKNRLRGWLIVKSNLKPLEFSFADDIMMIGFQGYKILLGSNRNYIILRFPWATIPSDELIVRFEWVYDKGEEL